MSEGERRRIQWRSAPSLRLHGTLALGLAGCVVASIIEWRRAFSGHAIAWVYAFEWPLFAVAGTWVWWKLLHGEDPAPRRTTRQPNPSRIPDSEAQPPDEQLLAWQAYLARLHASDPPGGPPQR